MPEHVLCNLWDFALAAWPIGVAVLIAALAADWPW